jgi:hypothetical protein
LTQEKLVWLTAAVGTEEVVVVVVVEVGPPGDEVGVVTMLLIQFL